VASAPATRHLSPALVPLIEQKCAVRDVCYESPTDFIGEDLFAVARNEWQKQLLPFVPGTPQVEQCLAEVKTLILSVWEETL